MTGSYLKDIAKTTAQGDAREESYYRHFSNFLDEFSKSIGKTKTQITTLPKKTDAGNPDFRIWDGKQHIVGYIEAKKPGENLDVIETTNQLKRYRSTFPNLILTDFYEFRLYRNGQLIDKASIGRPFVAKKLKEIPPLENEEKFNTLLEKFFAFTFPKVFTAESLAVELAKRTGFLRDEVIAEELKEEEQGKGTIYGFYTAFKNYLVADLTQHDFADIYSQTITYGLFAARTRANGAFTRKAAYDLIPQTIGILRDVFHFISLGKLPVQMEVIVDDIAEVLQAADVNKILDEYYHKGKGEDPIVHFYETFLNIYDPATREKRGVYYTPEPVVKYIVRSIHDLLKTHFDLQDGLASKEVTLLDPAGGTLTFPAEAIKLAVEEFTGKYGNAGKKNFIRNQVLKNFYAFELMMAPYAIGHIKISFLLEELGYKMQDDDRFKLYLTNTLDMEDLQQTEIPGLGSLSEESHLAGKVKQKEPILVILGNPPYSGHSANSNEWTEKLLKENIDGAQSYYEVDGEPLGEKNPKWLQDDYVKFLRFDQWKISKAGEGIVGMITNHSYLDNPTFRGMRQSLLKSFNEIYIIDLHGNTKKKETAPDGSKDENVFDIQQGVAIAIMVKKKNGKGCKVYHHDIFGLREDKYKWLEKMAFKKKDYEILNPETPWYFLIRRNTKEIEHYDEWISVNNIFPIYNTGIVTKRDNLAISLDPSSLLSRIKMFANKQLSDQAVAETFNIPIRDKDKWDLKKAREAIQKENDIRGYIHTISYRPFDIRFIFYHDIIVARTVSSVMQHMIKGNIGLTIGRQGQVVGLEHKWNLAFITEDIVDLNLFYRGGELLFPLYLYPTEEKKKKSAQALLMFEPETEYGKKGKKPNIAPKVFEQLEKAYKKKPTPEQILYYCYAVLYSNIYREKYAEFLKIDFPRIPFTSDYNSFQQLAKLGEELAELHLLKHKSLNHPTTKYFGKGDSDKIEKPVYDEDVKRVFINESRYFDNISPEVWNYQIGGYQPMEKYLKDRKGRQMDDPAHYCKMAAAISKTIELQKEIDKHFTKAEEKVIVIK
jgi:predicted helicase